MSALSRRVLSALALSAIVLLLGVGRAEGLRADPAPDDARTEVERLVTQALEAERRFEPLAALDLLKQAEALRPNDPFILQRISRQYSDSTLLQPTPAEKRPFAERALHYAQRAYMFDPKNPVNVLSLAICYGKLGLYGDTQTKVDNARHIHEHASEALRLDPDYDWAHHVLGRWHLEVASLGGTKRFFVRMFFGGLPAASYTEAVSHLERAVELAPEALSHHIELGFAYRAVGREADAQAAFARGLALESREIHDEPAKARARLALASPKKPAN
jgi:tetratricopeptide (TPR) repeat protein